MLIKIQKLDKRVNEWEHNSLISNMIECKTTSKITNKVFFENRNIYNYILSEYLSSWVNWNDTLR